MVQDISEKAIKSGKTVLGVEFGSTRIKAVERRLLPPGEGSLEAESVKRIA